MEFLKVIFFFFFFKCVFCEFDKASLFKPCPVEDIECVKRSIELFFEKSSPGIPEYNIKPLDPVFLPMIRVEGGKDIMIHYKNVSIFGLKNSKVTDLKLDTTAKFVMFSTTQDVQITADKLIKLEDNSETFQGKWTATASTVCVTHYDYDIVKDNSGVEHFEIIPDSIINHCELPEEPQVTLNKEAQVDSNSERDAINKGEESHPTQTRKTAVSKIMNEAFSLAIYNLAAACKVMLRSNFYTNY